MLKLAIGLGFIFGGTYATLAYSYEAIIGPLFPPTMFQFAQIAAISVAAFAASNFVGYRFLSSHFSK